MTKERRTRIAMTLIGVCLSGFSVGFFRTSLFGTDPFQCMVGGLSNQLAFLSFGTIYTIINIILLITVFFLDKHYIGIATFINLFFLGYIVEYVSKVLHHFLPDPSLAIRIALLAFGIVVLCFASSLYYTADLGVSTYDAIALILTDRKVGKFKYIRICTDLICVVIGVLFRATAGIGTVITAFFMGPLIEVFNVKFSRPFLEKRKE